VPGRHHQSVLHSSHHGAAIWTHRTDSPPCTEHGRRGERRNHIEGAREEAARELARSRTRDLEFVWANFLTRGMEQGAIPEADPRLLARAILGLYNSVFHWYRPGGDLALTEVADFYVRRCLAVAGLPMDVVGAGAKPARPRTAKAASRARAASR